MLGHELTRTCTVTDTCAYSLAIGVEGAQDIPAVLARNSPQVSAVHSLFALVRTYSLSRIAIRDEGTLRAFAESIAANSDITLVDLQGVDLSPYVDVLGVSDEPCDPRARAVCKGRNSLAYT
jgi:hypothetical protein